MSDRRLAAATAGAAVTVAACTALASADDPAAWEIDSFRTLNDLPDWVFPLIWPVMQYGVFITIPIAGGIAWWRGRHRLAALTVSVGTAVYLGAKVIKRVAGRERPAAFLTAVTEREDFAAGSVGYLSGHAAVAATIATLTYGDLPRPWRIATVAAVGVVSVGRIHVGGHFALDMVGGVALGIAAGGAATLLSRRVDQHRSIQRPRPHHATARD